MSVCDLSVVTVISSNKHSSPGLLVPEMCVCVCVWRGSGEDSDFHDRDDTEKAHLLFTFIAEKKKIQFNI